MQHDEKCREILKYYIIIGGISCILVLIIPLSFTIICFEKGIRIVANLGTICPRHKGFGLANTSVASGQRDPSGRAG